MKYAMLLIMMFALCACGEEAEDTGTDKPFKIVVDSKKAFTRTDGKPPYTMYNYWKVFVRVVDASTNELQSSGQGGMLCYWKNKVPSDVIGYSADIDPYASRALATDEGGAGTIIVECHRDTRLGELLVIGSTKDDISSGTVP